MFVKFPYGVNNYFLIYVRNVTVYGQREHGSRKSYGIQHLFVVRAYAAVCRLGVQRFRIIHHRFYTVFQQSAPELVAVIFRYGQRILVIYVYSHAVFMRQTYHFQITEHIVIVSCRPASMENPFVDMRQFHAQNSRLYSVETGIQTDILMTIFYALSMACKSVDLVG